MLEIMYESIKVIASIYKKIEIMKIYCKKKINRNKNKTCLNIGKQSKKREAMRVEGGIRALLCGLIGLGEDNNNNNIDNVQNASPSSRHRKTLRF